MWRGEEGRNTGKGWSQVMGGEEAFLGGDTGQRPRAGKGPAQRIPGVWEEQQGMHLGACLTGKG